MKPVSNRHASEALAATSLPALITDATRFDNPIVYANAAFTAMCGYALAEVVGRNCRFLQGPDTDPRVTAEIRVAVAAGQGIRREILNYRKDGIPYWNDLTIDPIWDVAGRLTGFTSIQRKMDEIHHALEEKGELESRLESIANHINGYIYRRVLRTNGAIEIDYCSPSIRKLIGVGETEVLRSFYNHVHPDDRDTLTAAVRRSAAQMSIFREEFRLVSSSGAVHWVRSEAPPRRMANGEIVWDGLALEFSAEKRWESEIADYALRDPLTGLLTRSAWRQALALKLSAESGAIGTCAVICSDIAAFSNINEKLGQSVGDEILRETAKRIAELAASVAGVAARLGGDEFAILVPACADEDSLSRVANSLSDALARPMQIGTEQITVLTCIGAALHQSQKNGMTIDGAAASELMTQAEFALRWAKQEGGSAHILYSPERDDRRRNRAALASSLEHAIASDELELHYQPLVDLASGRIVSAEALVRWNHPTLGMQRPDLFIPLAETSGLILPLGRWVVERAFRQHRHWREAGLVPPSLAINVSGIQLMQPGFAALVEEALKAEGGEAANFEIELTEGLLVEPSPQIMASLHALRTVGFTITIDDFGSGHATFRYLRDFPVDKLKIDQVFVRKLVLESTDALIIRAVISLARSMGIAFVAEGIETDMQRAFLEHEGCAIGQGYLFSMPLAAEDFAWMLANDVRLPLRGPVEHTASRKPIRPEAEKGAHP